MLHNVNINIPEYHFSLSPHNYLKFYNDEMFLNVLQSKYPCFSSLNSFFYGGGGGVGKELSELSCSPVRSATLLSDLTKLAIEPFHLGHNY